jgi:hypothetical protein
VIPLSAGSAGGSRLSALRQMRIPGASRFRRNLGKAHPGWRIGNADQVLARQALNLPTRKLRFALERLIAVCAIEFEFGCVHGFH